MRFNLKAGGLEIALLCLTFYEPNIVPHYFFLAFKYIVLLYLFIKHLRNIAFEKGLYFFVFFYGIVTVISTIVGGLGVNTVVASIFYMLQILDLFLVSRAFSKRYSLKYLVKYVLAVFLSFSLITDVLILLSHDNSAISSTEYFVGSKFTVAYMHCFTMAMLSIFIIDGKRNGFNYKQFAFLIYAFISVFVSFKVDCMTGVVCNVIMIVLLLFPKLVPIFPVTAVMNDKAFIITGAVINILIFGSYSLFSTSFIQDIVIRILGRNASLTGRLPIYRILIETINKKPWIGYGYFNSEIQRIVGYGNAQNGVMKIVIDSGILGLIGYIGILHFSLKNKNLSFKETWPLFAFLYSMLVASSVEINLTHMIFFFTVSIIFAYNRQPAQLGRKQML